MIGRRWRDHPDTYIPSSQYRCKLDRNDLTGTIPTELARLNLKYLYLFQNRLEGFIPREIGKIKSLEYLELSRNNSVYIGA